MHKALTLDAALKAHEAETVTGTITITFDLDTAGRARRRTRVKMIQIAWPNGRIDTQTVTDTLTRTLGSLQEFRKRLAAVDPSPSRMLQQRLSGNRIGQRNDRKWVDTL